jgi:hypothetical protein
MPTFGSAAAAADAKYLFYNNKFKHMKHGQAPSPNTQVHHFQSQDQQQLLLFSYLISSFQSAIVPASAANIWCHYSLGHPLPSPFYSQQILLICTYFTPHPIHPTTIIISFTFLLSTAVLFVGGSSKMREMNSLIDGTRISGGIVGFFSVFWYFLLLLIVDIVA